MIINECHRWGAYVCNFRKGNIYQKYADLIFLPDTEVIKRSVLKTLLHSLQASNVHVCTCAKRHFEPNSIIVIVSMKYNHTNVSSGPEVEQVVGSATQSAILRNKQNTIRINHLLKFWHLKV